MSDDEEGAMVVLLGAFLLAFAAFVAVVVDTGRVAHERAQLQNGGDAAALAVALACAGPDGCPPDPRGEAERYLGANVRTSDPTASVVITGTRARGTVEVTATNPDLPFSGDGGSTAVRSAAVATWAPAGAATTIPLAIADCMWEASPLDATEITVEVRQPLGHGVEVDPPCGGDSGEAAVLEAGSDCETSSSLVGAVPERWVHQSPVPPAPGVPWDRCLDGDAPRPVVVFGDWCGAATKPACPAGVGHRGREAYEVHGYGFFDITDIECSLLDGDDGDPALPRCTISGSFVPGVITERPIAGRAFGASTVRLER